MLLCDFAYNLELLDCLKLGSSGSDYVKSSGIPVLIDEFICELDVIILKES